MEYPPCKLGRDQGTTRDNPRNQEAAFALQFHDTSVVLWQCAHAENREPFQRELAVLEVQITAYRQLIGAA